jgi:hypothetical protein
MARRVAEGRAARLSLAAPALLAQLVEHLHGKEGVNGSSPLEGFAVFGLVERNSARGVIGR